MKLITCETHLECLSKAKECIYNEVDSKTVLFLSGGSTPKSLYETLAKEEIVRPGAVAMIDERFGEKWHKRSNELMVKETGLLTYFEHLDIPWHPILHNTTLEDTAKEYDVKVRELLFNFPKSVAIMGIGSDGHTAGIPAKSQIPSMSLQTKSQIFSSEYLVTSYNDVSGKYGERITMTFTALSMIDTLIVLALGEEKQNALQQIFAPGSLEELPGRFYAKQDISQKTILITDQNV